MASPGQELTNVPEEYSCSNCNSVTTSVKTFCSSPPVKKGAKYQCRSRIARNTPAAYTAVSPGPACSPRSRSNPCAQGGGAKLPADDGRGVELTRAGTTLRSIEPATGELDREMAPSVWAEVAYGLALFFLVTWVCLWIIHLTAIIYGKWKFHRKTPQQPRKTPYPGVSIIKPLVGVDPNLFSNLQTYFTMNYPQYEILLCIHDESDPSRMLVEKLIEKYPHVETRVFIGGEKVGINPKINNMQPGYEAAKYNLILVSDSGIRMKEDTLLDMVNHMTDEVGMVHQMPFTSDRNGFAAVLEKVYFGTIHARMYVMAEFYGILCASGMSALMRKNVLDQVGGFKTFGRYLAEDYFFSKTIQERGWKIRMSSQPALQNSGFCDVFSFQTRVTRWAKLRLAMLPTTTMFFEPISECVLLGALSSWAVNFLFQWDPIAWYLVHLLLWFLLDWILLSVVQNGPPPFSKLEFVVAWIFREACAPSLFLKAIFDPTIRWRDGVYRLKWGGFVEEVGF